MVFRGWGSRNGEGLLNGYGVSFREMKMCWNYMDVMVTQYCDDTKCYRTVHFLMVYFMFSEFHLNKHANLYDLL